MLRAVARGARTAGESVLISPDEAEALADLIDAAKVSLVHAQLDDEQIHGEWGLGPYKEHRHVTALRDALAALDADA